MVKMAITSILEQGVPIMADPFAPSEMLSQERLAEPRKPIERAAPSALRKVVVSDEQMAKSRIMLKARASRTVNLLGLSNYTKEQLAGRDSVTNEDLQLNTISDVRMYQSLSALSLQMSAKSRKLQMDAISMTRGFRVEVNGNIEVPHSHISSLPFKITARNAAKK